MLSSLTCDDSFFVHYRFFWKHLKLNFSKYFFVYSSACLCHPLSLDLWLSEETCNLFCSAKRCLDFSELHNVSNCNCLTKQRVPERIEFKHCSQCYQFACRLGLLCTLSISSNFYMSLLTTFLALLKHSYQLFLDPFNSLLIDGPIWFEPKFQRQSTKK